MTILSKMRLIAEIDVILLTKLLSVSKYAYLGYENGDRRVPNEIVYLLAKIYNVDISTLYNGIDEKTEQELLKIRNMQYEEKKEYLIKNLLGDNVKLTYHNVNNLKRKYLMETNTRKGDETS